MENASKALLIAGAILIAILLIAMGVKVVSSTSGTTDSVYGKMNATEIEMFNNKFLPYAGSGKTAIQVKSLANLVIAHNGVNDTLEVSFRGTTDTATITEFIKTLEDKKYTINLRDTNNDGLVDDIEIIES